MDAHKVHLADTEEQNVDGNVSESVNGTENMRPEAVLARESVAMEEARHQRMGTAFLDLRLYMDIAPTTVRYSCLDDVGKTLAQEFE